MGAQFTIPLITVIPGQLIASALWNNEFQNINTNFIPAGMDSYSNTDAQMQITTNPYPGNVTSHATSLGGEIERIRYQINQLIGPGFWYQPPSYSMASIPVIPVGGMIAYPWSVILPLGASPTYLACNGQAVSRTAWPALNNIYSALAYPFGNGDGSTTFNLPNITDRFIVGAGVSYGINSQGGEATHTLTSAEVPATAVSITDPGHGHSVTDPTHLHNERVGSSGGTLSVAGTGGDGSTNTHTYNVTESASTGVTVNNNTTGISASVSGSGQAHNNLPPYIGLFWFVRAG